MNSFPYFHFQLLRRQPKLKAKISTRLTLFLESLLESARLQTLIENYKININARTRSKVPREDSYGERLSIHKILECN